MVHWSNLVPRASPPNPQSPGNEVEQRPINRKWKWKLKICVRGMHCMLAFVLRPFIAVIYRGNICLHLSNWRDVILSFNLSSFRVRVRAHDATSVWQLETNTWPITHHYRDLPKNKRVYWSELYDNTRKQLPNQWTCFWFVTKAYLHCWSFDLKTEGDIVYPIWTINLAWKWNPLNIWKH